MLRHKYTKKRLKNSRKKRTRKQRGGGGKSSKSSTHKKKQRREGERLNRSRLNQSPPEDALSPGEIRNLAQFKALENGEKCESVNHVNDDGSIDCPKTRSLARKKTIKFHEDKNPGCKEYANDMMSQYNKTCYGDDTNTDRKWDKTDKTWRNNKFTGFYQDPTTSVSEHKELPSSCRRPAKKMVCRYCQAKGVTDPKCKCCVGTDMAKEAIAKEQLQNQQPSKSETKSETKSEKTPTSNTCFAPQIDPNSGGKYWVERKPDATFTGKTQWEEPTLKQQCEPGVPLSVDLNQPIIVPQPAPDVLTLENIQPSISEIDTKISQPLPEPLPETKLEIIPTPTPGPTNNTCFISQPDPNSDRKYWVERKTDGTFTDTSQWKEPPLEQQCKDLKPKTWDASKTVGNCREMDLHPGTEYWINPTDGSMSFEPIDGVEKQLVLEETDYYYNSNGETTFDPNDGTCGDMETNAETKEKKTPDSDFISLFFTSHFTKMQELDNASERKVIPWLSR